MNEQKVIWIDQLEDLIQKKHMLNHPFYEAWMRGELKKATLQSYAKEYYQHVKAFPGYISALHSRCEDLKIRRALLDNLMDEEAGDPNHLQLWKEFTLALGVDEEELDAHAPQEATRNLIARFRHSCSHEGIAAGIAALYSYESQIPAICQTKIEGLKKHYGLTCEGSYRYFSVHETVDIEHAQEEKEMLLALLKPEEEGKVLEQADLVLDSLGNFLSSFKI